MHKLKSFILIMLFGVILLWGCERSITDEIAPAKEKENDICSSPGPDFINTGDLLHFKNWKTVENLSTSLNEDEKLNYFNESPSSFKSAAYYYDKALSDLYENDNTLAFVNQLKTKYPGCIKIEMLPDSSANLVFTSNARSLTWILNQNNQVIVDSAVYTFNAGKQTIEFLRELKEKPVFDTDGANVVWVSDNKVEITTSTLKSLISTPGTRLVRKHKWNGKYRLQAALSIEHLWVGNPTTYNKKLNKWQTRQIRRLWVHYKQDRKMWYGWTKKPTTFQYKVKSLRVRDFSGAWVDIDKPPFLEGSFYGREKQLPILTKKRTVDHYNPDRYKLPTYLKNLVFSISVDVKSGQVPLWFNLSFSNLNTYEY